MDVAYAPGSLVTARGREWVVLPESTEDSLLGGLVVLTSRSILAGDGPLPELLPDLVEFVLAPYLGPERAKALAREAAADDRRL